MDTNSTVVKFRNCLYGSWKIIREEIEKYRSFVRIGTNHVSSLIAHKTTLKSVISSTIEDSELLNIDSDIKLNLQFTIKKEIDAEIQAVTSVLSELQRSYLCIMTQIERIFNVFKNCNFNIDEVTEVSETFLSFAEVMDALDGLKRLIYDDHLGRKSTIEIFHFIDGSSEIMKIWDFNKISSAEHDLNCILDPAM